ncbi:MAG: N-acetyltransferase [Acidobacteria bacterium]|nr:N-acetyltransferase [Acidobacteriota bacterium]
MESYYPQSVKISESAACRFRNFQSQDFKRICELDKICFAEGIAYTPEEIAYFLSAPGAFCCVGQLMSDHSADSTSVADASTPNIVAWILASSDRRGTGHIITIDVHPDYQRRNIGEIMMELAEKRLQQKGCSRVLLEVAIGNSGAIFFYERLDYKTARELSKYYSDGTNAYQMKKML